MAVARHTHRLNGTGRTVTPSSGDTRAADWHAEALSAYGEARRDQPEPSHELIAAVRQLTGRTLPRDTIVVDTANQAAFGVIDGVRLRWSQAQLTLIRPCDHCGCGTFASPAIHSLAELGFALSAWQALHHECQPFAADELD